MNEIEKLLRIGICSNCHDNVDRNVCNGYIKKCPTRDEHKFIIENLLQAGIGDVKQAVREFAERLKESCTFDGHRVALDRNKIDELIKEVCGE